MIPSVFTGNLRISPISRSLRATVTAEERRGAEVWNRAHRVYLFIFFFFYWAVNSVSWSVIYLFFLPLLAHSLYRGGGNLRNRRITFPAKLFLFLSKRSLLCMQDEPDGSFRRGSSCWSVTSAQVSGREFKIVVSINVKRLLLNEQWLKFPIEQTSACHILI